jgi:hypothetical protein
MLCNKLIYRIFHYFIRFFGPAGLQSDDREPGAPALPSLLSAQSGRSPAPPPPKPRVVDDTPGALNAVAGMAESERATVVICAATTVAWLEVPEGLCSLF